MRDQKHQTKIETGEKYVYATARGYRATSSIPGEQKCLGLYASVESAAIARDNHSRLKNPLIVDNSKLLDMIIPQKLDRLTPVKFEYFRGDIIGDYGIKYLEEKIPNTYITNKGKRNKIRMALLECGKCKTTFAATIAAIRSGNTKSCGCLKIKQATERGKYLNPLSQASKNRKISK